MRFSNTIDSGSILLILYFKIIMIIKILLLKINELWGRRA